MSSRKPRNARRPARSTLSAGLAADQRRKLREAQENLEHGGAAIMALIYMAHLGVVHSGEAIAGEAEEIAARDVPCEEDFQAFQVRRLLREITAQTANAAVDSAAILYAHAVLTGVIDRLCDLSWELDAEVWTGELEGQGTKPELQSLSISPKAPPPWFGQASLHEKCEMLLKVNKHGGPRDALREFKYSGERLKKFDQLRRHLVEQTGFHRKMREAQEKIDYLLNAGQFFINLLTRHHAHDAQERGPRPPRAKKAKATPAASWQQGELL